MQNLSGEKIVRDSAARHSIARLSRLALLCGTAAALPAMAVAQAAPPPSDETKAQPAAPQSKPKKDEIVITGIRGSILKSINTKRYANSIIDVITAEDVGKFPDANMADALQRVPGVSIDRFDDADSQFGQGTHPVPSGEGRHASINGLGSQFTLALLNGRQIASADNTRSFSFDTLASNLVHQIDVYKTANADVPEGGLAGVVDVRTARPFDFKGLRGTVQMEYEYGSNSKTGFPQFTGVISDRFFGGRLGVLLSFTHQRKRVSTDFVETPLGWNKNYFLDPVAGAYMYDQSPMPTWSAGQIDYGRTVSDRKRDGGTAVIQWQATDKLTLTADYLYSKFTTTDATTQSYAYLNAITPTANGSLTPTPPIVPSPNITTSPLSIVNSNGIYTQLDISGGTCLVVAAPTCNAVGGPVRAGVLGAQFLETHRPTTTQMAGFNAEWRPSSKFRGVVDAYWSRAVDDNPGLDSFNGIEWDHTPEYLVKFPDNGGPPSVDLKGYNPLADLTDLGIAGVTNAGATVKAVNKGGRADFDWNPDPSMHLRFGASYTTENKKVVDYVTGGSNDTTPGLPDSFEIYELYHFKSLGQPFPLSTVTSGLLTLGSNLGVTSPVPILAINQDALRAWMANPANLALRGPSSYLSLSNTPAQTLAAFVANGSSWMAEPTGAGFNINEKDISAYVEVSKDFHIGPVPASLIAGVRYARTEVDSFGKARILTGYALASSAGGLTPIYAPGGAQPVTSSGSNSQFLPSANLKFDLQHNLLLRLAVAKTMTRPDLADLAGPTTGYGGTIKKRTASGGNPNLAPYTSLNFDTSLEWYFSKRGLLAVAGFYKDISGFIYNIAEPEQVTAITSVPSGVDLTLQQLQTTYVTRPHNASNATIKGFTLSGTQTFPFGGGLQVNYSKVWSKVRPGAGVPTFDMPGISDTANIVAFYEKHRISARVAWNWRSHFLIYPANGTYSAIFPSSPYTLAQYADNYWQIDARLGYDLPYGVNMAVSVNNLTKSKNRYYSGSTKVFNSLFDSGRTFTLTATKKF